MLKNKLNTVKYQYLVTGGRDIVTSGALGHEEIGSLEVTGTRIEEKTSAGVEIVETGTT